jgi:8-amino-7-oxononanoate synthase
VARLRANTERFRRRAAEAGLEAGPGPAPVVPILTGTSTGALLLADRMRRRGVNVQPIVYPAVPDAAARLRFFLNTSHTDAQIDEAVVILAQETDGPAPAAFPRDPRRAGRRG